MSIFCSQCGVAVTDESKFCFKCGGAIHEGSSSTQSPAHTTPTIQGVSDSRTPTTVASLHGTPPLEPGEQMQRVIESRIGISKWWPIVTAFTLFLFMAIVQNKRQYSTLSLGERLIIVLSVASIYTAIAAIYFARSKKRTFLTPWEVEARSVANGWYLFVAVTLSSLVSLFFLLQNLKVSGVHTTVEMILVALFFVAGWAAWRGQTWAVAVLFVWEFVGVIIESGGAGALGVFVVVLAVQTYRYQRSAKQFAELNVPDLLGTLTGLTKLSYAAARSELYYAKYLIKSGADVNERTTTGHTPLMLAAATNRDGAVIKYLLKIGADKTATSLDGRQAVDFARERGAMKLVSLLAA